jgi:hypothetical protein
LGPGNYAVLETLEESVSDDIQTFVENNPDRALMLTLESSFTGDCTFFQTLPLEAEARGTIDAGESQTCNTINPFLITDITPPPP